MLALFAGEDEIGGRGRIELVDFKGPVEHRNVPPKKIHEHALARLEHGAKCRTTRFAPFIPLLCCMKITCELDDCSHLIKSG
ncbi:hypothetical protein AB433_17570 [Croceicoccus naphthovorans]|uniref:Uncharacterized protein n=1 Tax=Croceicoccus naphthovorans TaxID=1348774 RepID=A0A0G3XLA5_9SPHN|nr:hypothetical protein AB433_17570 [Croceicoccus naphthovorans]